MRNLPLIWGTDNSDGLRPIGTTGNLRMANMRRGVSNAEGGQLRVRCAVAVGGEADIGGHGRFDAFDPKATKQKVRSQRCMKVECIFVV